MTNPAETTVFVEFHLLRSLPPSNVNRDDLGSPKSCMFGGVRRLRVSSQALKRMWRRSPYFTGALAADQLGVRTQEVPLEVQKRLESADLSKEAREGLSLLFAALGKKSAKPGKDVDGDDDGPEEETSEAADAPPASAAKTAHLLYVSRQEIDQLAEFAKQKKKALEGAFKVKKGKAEADPEKLNALRKELKAHLEGEVTRNAADISMFGRFLTSDEFGQVDACVQVAHALGTQRLEIDYDYFTAVDDLSGEAGAGHIGETELAAGVLYEYAVCNLTELRTTLVKRHGEPDKQIAAKALRALGEAMVRAVPEKGKKNSTAPHTPGDYLEVIVRKGQPLSLANAFLKAVRPTDEEDVMGLSIKRLVSERTRHEQAFGASDVVARGVYSLRDVDGSERNLKTMLDGIQTSLENAH